MKQLPAKRLTAIGLRLWTLATRFFFVFFLARYLAPADVGLYGLIAATSGYVIYVLGVDMYTYTTREILKADRSTWRSPVRSHIAFLACVYVIVLPFMLLLFTTNLLPWSVAVWFFLIAITEHVSMEIDRMLISMSDQLGASVVIFARQAMLPTVVVPLLAFVPAARDLQIVLTLWVAFNIFATIVGWFIISRRLKDSDPGVVDWNWIRRGIKVSLLFFTGTLFLRVLFTVDRQIVAFVDGLDVLGAYTLAMSVGTGLSSVIAVAVHQFSYPKLVVAANEKDRPAFNRELRAMTWQTISLVVIAAAAVMLMRDFLLSFVGGGIYAQYEWLFLASIAVYGLYNISLLAHFALYAIHADRAILVSTVVSVVAFAFTVALCLGQASDAAISVVVGLAVASIALLLTKGGVALRRVPDAFAAAK